MIYFTKILGEEVYDSEGELVGTVNDLAIETREIFPRVTSIAFVGPDKRPFMLSWRRFVEDFSPERITLNAPQKKLRFSYLQPAEVLLARDLLDHQIVDTQGIKVVRVNDVKLTESRKDLRVLGADVGVRGILRRLNLERPLDIITSIVRYRYPERLIAWNYIDLLEKDLSGMKLSVTHKRLFELHPADIADIIGQMEPEHRARVFEHLDLERASDTISESEPEVQAELVESLGDEKASDLLEIMPPDDAADIIGGLPYEKAEILLNLMGFKEAAEVRKLLGYREHSAGGIMTTDYIALSENLTVEETLARLREAAPEAESIYYVYVVDEENHLKGVLSLRDLIVSSPETHIHDTMLTDIISVDVDDDQEEVADVITKYDLIAAPVIDESGRLVGIVTVDDVLEVMEQESAEDIAILTGSKWTPRFDTAFSWFVQRSGWLTVWLFAGAVAGSILHFYSGMLERLLAIVFFVPLILRISDDVGNRSVATIIQSLEGGEEQKREGLLKRTTLDLLTAAGIGLLSGLLAIVLLLVWRQPPREAIGLSVSVAATIVLVGATGTLLPLALKRLSVDPAVATRPIVTTGMSALGLVIYLGLAGAIRF